MTDNYKSEELHTQVVNRDGCARDFATPKRRTEVAKASVKLNKAVRFSPREEGLLALIDEHITRLQAEREAQDLHKVPYTK